VEEKTNAIRSYRDLVVWQDAMSLAESCYRLVANYPKDELYGLTSQIRRAAVSIPSNIAEGYGRESSGSYLQFLKVSRGSLRELETQIMLSERVGVATTEQAKVALEKCDHVGKKLHGLIAAVQRTSKE
jgi:four helix bundle protein